MLNVEKISVLGAIAFILLLNNPANSNNNVQGGILIGKLTHYGSSVLVGFSNYAYSSNDCLPADNPVNNSHGSWNIVLRTTDPYYKEYLAILLTAKAKNLPVDITWHCGYSYKAPGDVYLRYIVAVGFSQ